MRRLSMRGVTLLELLVAMMLMAVALVGLAASQTHAMYGVTASGLRTAATLLAQECIEQARSMPYDRIPEVAASCPPRPPGHPGLTRAVTTATGTPTATTTTVTVTVGFGGRQGASTTRVDAIFAR